MDQVNSAYMCTTYLSDTLKNILILAEMKHFIKKISLCNNEEVAPHYNDVTNELYLPRMRFLKGLVSSLDRA